MLKFILLRKGFKNIYNIITLNIDEWWSSQFVRNAREKFCFKYSRKANISSVKQISKIFRSLMHIFYSLKKVEL